MTKKEAIKGFEMDNALLAGTEDGVVERNNLAIEALKQQIKDEQTKTQIGCMKIELLRNNDWYKLKLMLEMCGYTVNDIGNDEAIIKYLIKKL